MKNRNVNGKTWTKNNRLFFELGIFRYEEFLKPLMDMRKDFGLLRLKEVTSITSVLSVNPTSKEWSHLSTITRRCHVNRLDFLSRFDNDEKTEFYSMIEIILRNNNLGSEWKLPLGDFVINGLFIPPFYNLDIQAERITKKVTLILNPSTSLTDIKNAWNAIEAAKKEVYGNLKRRNLSNKSINDLIILAKVKQLQKKDPQLKGLDLVGRLYPHNDDFTSPSTKDDKKASNKFRQMKSRFNRKL